MNAPSPAETRFATAYSTLIEPYGLNNAALDRVFGNILTHHVDLADLYF